jgi:hypothetical protein
MKPREFDGLVRRKFDEGGFEYKAQSWDMLAEQLDGNEKRRSIAIWLMPLIGIAASVVLAMGVPAVLNQGGGINQRSEARYAQIINTQPATDNYMAPEIAMSQTPAPTPVVTVAKHVGNKQASKQIVLMASKKESLLANNAGFEDAEKPTAVMGNTFKNKVALNVFNNAIGTFAAKDGIKKVKKITRNIGFYTFKEPVTNNAMPKVAISVLGGVNYGVQANGFIVGATVRRMINDKVYVEGDIAFLGTSNTSKFSEIEYTETTTPGANFTGNSKSAPIGIGAGSPISYSGPYGSSATMAHAPNTAARGAVTERSTSDVPTPPATVTQSHVKVVDKNYNLYYAQVTPTIGYKLVKRMSVGIGPDFQQMLVDNRPVTSPDATTGNIQEVPMFDIGFMGKTEYAVSKNIKAAIYYREGINNIITPMNRYVDRNYVQFQIKCAILNR